MSNELQLEAHKVTVKVAKVLFPKKRNDWNGWGIVSVEPIKTEIDFKPKLNFWKNFIIRGNIPMAMNEGQEYDLEISDLKTDPKYGDYYEVIRVHVEALDTVEAQQRFLMAVIKEHKANLIISQYPNAMVIDDINSGAIDLTTIKGIGESTAKKIKRDIEKNKDMGALIAELSDLNLTTRMLNNIIDKFGSSTHALISVQESLYNLCSVSGISFKRVDEVALARGEDKFGNKRIRAYSEHSFDEIGNQGHSWVAERVFLEKAIADLDIIGTYIRDYMDSEDGQLSFYWQKEKKRISSVRMYNNERNTLRNLLRLATKYKAPTNVNYDKEIQIAEEKLGVTYTEEQRNAITESMNHGVFILNGKGGTGKALSNDSTIKTPNGDVEIGEIKVGTKVFNSYGSISEVIGVYPQGEKEVWEVEFSDGTVVECCEEHLWNYQTSSQRDRKTGYKTATIKEIYEQGLKRDSVKTSRWGIYIPMSEPVAYNKKELMIPPYAMGVIIGDGGISTDSINITNNEDDVLEKTNIELNKIGYHLKHKDRYSYSVVMNDRKKTSPLRVELEKLGLLGGLSYDKFIPIKYLQSSVEDRVELLKGLIDTDGECQNSNYYYCTSSRRLANDVVELAQSLGMTASLKERQTYYTYKGERKKGKISFRASIKTTEDIPKIHSSKKHESKWKKGQSVARRTIRRITPTGVKKAMTCIQVNSKDNLFLTGGFVVTHNTTVVKGIVEIVKSLGKTYQACALSGKASQVLLSKDIVSATIHRTFGIGIGSGATDGDLDIDVIIIDESSMINAGLFSILLNKIKSGAKVVIVGDSGQLSGIGHGDVLRDLLQTKFFKVIELEQIHRQAQDSGIIEVASMIREGKQICNAHLNGQKIFGVNKDMVLLGYKDKEAIPNDLERVLRGQAKRIKTTQDLMDFQIIVAIKEKGELSARALNILAQSIFNDLDKAFISNGGYDYREGDKVIVKGNSYEIDYFEDIGHYYRTQEEKALRESEQAPMGVDEDDNEIFEELEPLNPKGDLFNGTMGIVKQVLIEKDINDNEIKLLAVEFEGLGLVVYESNKLDSIELAYAVTCHRLQGSTIKNIFVVLDYSAFSLLSRQWVYTAITRASKKCVLMVQSSALVKAIGTDSSGQRQTFLGDMIVDVKTQLGELKDVINREIQ